MDIKTLPSPYGRCYSIYFDKALKTLQEFYGIRFNTTKVQEITLYVHEKDDEIGLLWSYWPIDPETFTVRENDQFIVTIQENTYTPRPQSSTIPCNIDDDYSYPKCVKDWIRRTYLNLFSKHNKTGEQISNHT